MRMILKCDLKDCAYCRPTKHVYKYNRHNAELSEDFLTKWWNRVKDKPVDFLFTINKQEVNKYE